MKKWPVVLALCLGATVAAALAGTPDGREATGSRQALLIANADYPDDNAPLRQPIQDARALADELRKADFEVAVGENLTKQAMRTAIADFKAKIKRGSAALIFFSGYGIQVARQNYMIPVNAQIWSETDVRRDGIGIDQVLTDLDGIGASVKLVVIDASRVNPFERRYRGFSAGLAAIKASPGTLIVYAAAPDQVGDEVSDASGENSLFVGQLIKEMRSTGNTAEQVFIQTARGVARVSDGRQNPWISSSLAEDFFFIRPSPAAKVAPPALAAAKPTKIDNDVGRASAKPPTMNDPNILPAEHANQPSPARDQLAKSESAPSAEPSSRRQPPDDRTLGEVNDEIQRNPDDAAAHFRRGLILAQQGQYRRAIRDFDQAIRINPQDPDAWNNRCWTRAIIGQLQAALVDCNKSLALKPNLVDAFDSLAFAYLKMGRVQRAITFYDAALRGNPENAASLFGRGKAKLRKGDAVGGNADIAAARAIKPDIAQEFASYGVR